MAATLIEQGLESSDLITLRGQNTSSFIFEEAALQNLSFFQDSTCSTLGTPNVQTAYRAEVVRLALTVSFIVFARRSQ